MMVCCNVLLRTYIPLTLAREPLRNVTLCYVARFVGGSVNARAVNYTENRENHGGAWIGMVTMV
jgi:hypothetical protein